MARSSSLLLACMFAAALFAFLGLRSLSFAGTSWAPALRSSTPAVERAGYGGSSGGKNYWEKWETGDYYLRPPPGTYLQGFEYGRNQLADGRTAGDEKGVGSKGPNVNIVLVATVFFFASVYANYAGFFNP
ncbi:unnamed protein product [Prorocentrum cordatum]|uniref:Uncharacterized protein n=1 Tax=Prorocentrum cordatum TaxID=2364126 RepID=A0ABN9PNV4_9DINO|nr:unnamed protein product [Polarella glacialis]